MMFWNLLIIQCCCFTATRRCRCNGQGTGDPTVGIVEAGGVISVEVYALGGRITFPHEVDASCLTPAANKVRI